MICIVGDRGSGKTTQLVKLSELTGMPIVVQSAYSARDVERVAERMGAKIRTPFPVSDRASQFLKIADRRVLVDEAQLIIEKALGCSVEVAVFDSVHVDEFTEMIIDPTTVSLWSLIRRWLSARKERRETTEIWI